MLKSHPWFTAIRALVLSLLLCVGLSAADANPAALSPEEGAFVQSNMNDAERAEFLKQLTAQPPGDRAAMEATAKAALAAVKALQVARGVSFGKPATGAAVPVPAAQAAKTPQQLDLELLQANLKPEEWQQVVNAYTMARGMGDMSSFDNTVRVYKARLAARGITPQNTGGGAFVDKRPKIDLAAYAPISTTKQADWIAAPAGERSKGFYREESINAQVQQVKVGVWEMVDGDSGQVTAKIGFNNQGVEIGPKWTYYTDGSTKPDQLQQIEVIYGLTPDAIVEGIPLAKLTKMDNQRLSMGRVIEVIQFHKNGSLAMWLRTEKDGRRIAQAYSPVGQLVLEEITSTDGILIHQSFYPDGKPKDWTKAKVGKASTYTDRSPGYVHKEWAANGDVSVVNIADSRVSVTPPSRNEQTPADAKQLIVWNDPADESKGVSGAGFITGTDTKVGPWIHWNAQGLPISGGLYAAGKRDGTWQEIEYNPTSTSHEKIAEHTGRYVDGVHVGIWQSDLFSGHPLVESAKQKVKAAAGGNASASINDMNGYKETTTYADGKAVKTERNFTP